MANEQPKREGKQLLLRFPDGSDLRDELSAAADKNGRSLSKEIIFRLEKSLQDAGGAGLTWISNARRLNAKSAAISETAMEKRLTDLERLVLGILADVSEIKSDKGKENG